MKRVRSSRFTQVGERLLGDSHGEGRARLHGTQRRTIARLGDVEQRLRTDAALIAELEDATAAELAASGPIPPRRVVDRRLDGADPSGVVDTLVLSRAPPPGVRALVLCSTLTSAPATTERSRAADRRRVRRRAGVFDGAPEIGVRRGCRAAEKRPNPRRGRLALRGGDGLQGRRQGQTSGPSNWPRYSPTGSEAPHARRDSPAPRPW